MTSLRRALGAAFPLALASLVAGQYGTYVDPHVLDACPGYNASNIESSPSSLKADLMLAGSPCDVFGHDIAQLTLQVVYETDSRIHVTITDPSTPRYEVPQSVLPRPAALPSASRSSASIQFNYTSAPFSFSIYRTQTNEVLFTTAGHPIIFEPQYLRVKTSLPKEANVYGLGEHTDPFRLPTHNTTRTMWSRDAYGVPPGTNLYGNHPIYFEHRSTGTHGVFFLNSNGMDIKINDTENSDVTTLEYNAIGGILDFYFLAGSESDPSEVARQYAEVVGNPAEVPYWSFGFHQCRYNYKDFVNIADVITNYSNAGIPLETMWTDIDYMYKRWIFTNDPQYFPTNRMREIVDYLHSHEQQYIMMTDPAVAYQPGENYGTFMRGVQEDIFLKNPNGSMQLGVVWPGVTVFPDWFNEKAQAFWNNEYAMFFNPATGIDIDGAWIDMNEPSSFCIYPCTDPFQQAIEGGYPPNRTTPPPDPNASIFGEPPPADVSSNSSLGAGASTIQSRMISSGSRWKRQQDLGDDVMNPPYGINNALPQLSDRTAYVDVVHENGLIMYDTHNLFGAMMSVATRNAMINRRPGLRPVVITRSTFAGSGNHTGKWLGDNFSQWEYYRFSIAGMLGMATIYQIPMVGSDICGYALDTTETLCARWAMLGAFYPFMRNHNSDTSISQEFYLWPTVTQAAKNAIDMRYRLLDYFYTAFHRQHMDGTPVLNPLWFKYPSDSKTWNIDLQFLFGDSILVSPVTEENVTHVDVYFPDDIFYDFRTLDPIRGEGKNVTFSDVNFTSIPVHIRGGAILPLRVTGANTTAQLRRTDLEVLVAPGLDGSASGSLYVDDGVSIVVNASTEVQMEMRVEKGTGTLTVNGSFGYPLGVNVARAVFLNVSPEPKTVIVDKNKSVKDFVYDGKVKTLSVPLGFSFDRSFEVSYS